MTKQKDIVDVLLAHANGEFDMTPLAADLLRAANEIQMLRVACRKLDGKNAQIIENKQASAAENHRKSLAQSILRSLKA